MRSVYRWHWQVDREREICKFHCFCQKIKVSWDLPSPNLLIVRSAQWPLDTLWQLAAEVKS